MTDYRLRVLSDADAGIYRELRLFMLKDSPTAFSSDYESALERPESHFRDRLRQQSGQFVIGAFATDTLIGTAGGYREDDLKRRHIATVWGMFVHPEHRGTGIGARLLDAVLERLRGVEELERVELAVTQGNEPALALYQHAGFEVYGREPDALKVDGVNHDELHLSLRT